MSDSDPAFDAVAAAKELDEMLGDTTGSGSEGGEYIATLEAEIEELHALVAQKEALLEHANQRTDQAHAEVEAIAKRLENASAKELEQRTHKLLESFLPVVDDLDRGIAAAKQHAESADVVTGLELVRRSMLGSLARFGVTHVPALGAKFDPHQHEAIAMVPVADPTRDGHVIDVMREGYAIGDLTLRPASVAVAKHSG